MLGTCGSELCYDQGAWASWHVYIRENVCSASSCHCVQPCELCCFLETPLLCGPLLLKGCSAGSLCVCSPVVVQEAEVAPARFPPSQSGNESHWAGDCAAGWDTVHDERENRSSVFSVVLKNPIIVLQKTGETGWPDWGSCSNNTLWTIIFCLIKSTFCRPREIIYFFPILWKKLSSLSA